MGIFGLRASLSLEASPYTIIRVGVMRTKLLTASDYHQLLHMSLPETLQKLQESDYAAEISGFALAAGTLERLDDALAHNLVRTMEKLRRICDEHTRAVIDTYAMRNDLWNLKTLLRALRGGILLEEARRRILPTGMLDAKEWDALIGAAQTHGLEGLIDALTRSPHQHLQRAASLLTEELCTKEGDEGRQPADLQRIPQANWENALERNYYTLVSEFIRAHGSSAAEFDEYFAEEIDTRNIETLFKLVREGLPPREIMDYLFPITHRPDAIPLAFWEQACRASGVAELFKRFGKTRYAAPIARAAKRHEETASLVALETELEKELLRHSQSLMHRHPLSVDVILGYLLAKATELRNLNSIVRGKQLGIPSDEIEEFLVMRQ